MLIAINIMVFVVLIMGYIIWNLTTKNIKLEEAVLNRDIILINMSRLIEDSEKQLKEVDRLGAFKSDDEIGFFFTTVLKIQQELNKFKI